MNKVELKETVRALNKIVAAQTAVILQHEDKIRDLEDQMAWYASGMKELEDTVNFYGKSVNNLEMIVKRLSEYQAEPPRIINNNGPDMRKVFPWTGIFH